VADLFDYIHWRGDLPMNCLPFTPVDGLILAWLASMPLDPGAAEVGEAAGLLSGSDAGEETRRLGRALAGSRRFAPMRLHRLEEKTDGREEMQFAAVTVFTGDNRVFVAYRGTDATLVGWKENFNMAFTDEVPAQREAVKYLNRVAGDTGMPLRVGGHSKGGNLAVYAAALCDPGTQSRIVSVYNFDGPGLSVQTVDSPGYRAVEQRVMTYLPESALVGILLERSSRYEVVRSDEAGILQHMPRSWQVTPSGFELAPSLSSQSLFADRTIRDWLNGMSRNERERFVETLYSVVSVTRAETVGDVAENWRKSGWAMLNAFAGLDFAARTALYRAIGSLLLSAMENLRGE